MEEEIVLFFGGIKEEFSWMIVLINDEIDESIREIVDVYGILFDSLIFVISFFGFIIFVCSSLLLLYDSIDGDIF